MIGFCEGQDFDCHFFIIYRNIAVLLSLKYRSAILGSGSGNPAIRIDDNSRISSDLLVEREEITNDMIR